MPHPSIRRAAVSPLSPQSPNSEVVPSVSLAPPSPSPVLAQEKAPVESTRSPPKTAVIKAEKEMGAAISVDPSVAPKEMMLSQPIPVEEIDDADSMFDLVSYLPEVPTIAHTRARHARTGAITRGGRGTRKAQNPAHKQTHAQDQGKGQDQGQGQGRGRGRGRQVCRYYLMRNCTLGMLCLENY